MPEIYNPDNRSSSARNSRHSAGEAPLTSSQKQTKTPRARSGGPHFTTIQNLAVHHAATKMQANIKDTQADAINFMCEVINQAHIPKEPLNPSETTTLELTMNKVPLDQLENPSYDWVLDAIVAKRVQPGEAHLVPNLTSKEAKTKATAAETKRFATFVALLELCFCRRMFKEDEVLANELCYYMAQNPTATPNKL